MAENIEQFKDQVMRAVGILFAAHPIPTRINWKDIDISNSEEADQSGFGKPFEVAAGTLKWLASNNIVSGTFKIAPPTASILDAQLTAMALQVLTRREPNIPGGSLGEYVAQIEAQSNPSMRKAAADLLFERFVG